MIRPTPFSPAKTVKQVIANLEAYALNCDDLAVEQDDKYTMAANAYRVAVKELQKISR